MPAGSNKYAGASESADKALDVFLRALQRTFGESLLYVGTTTPSDETRASGSADVDVMLVFTEMSEARIRYCGQIIQQLRHQFRIAFDVRLFDAAQIRGTKIPLVNRFLLKRFLRDIHGTNPFGRSRFSQTEISAACLSRIKEQQEPIIEALSLVSWDTAQIRLVCQAVFDALRAFLVLEKRPLAGKKEAVDYFLAHYAGFEELEAIFLSYADPVSVANVADLVLDAYAMVRHLFYRASAQVYADRAVLINTPSSSLPHPRDDYLSRDPNMPLGLVCLVSYCRERAQSVSILDAYAENLGALSVVDRLFEHASDLPKVVAMNSSSPNIHIAHEIARYVKRIAPDMTVVCGGPHATLAPGHTLGTGNVDYVVVGEGEVPFARLVDRVCCGQREEVPDIPGIATMLGKSLVIQSNPEVLDMAELPLPVFDALPLDRYFASRRRLYLHATRGCSYACIFCSVPKCWPGGVRVMPMAQLVSQMAHCQARYSATEFQIVDDNFSYEGGRIIRDFVQNLDQAGTRVRWKCQARADQLDGDLIAMMAESGCFEIDLGIESGSSRIQTYIRKNLDLDATRQVVEGIHRSGVFSKAFFMMGFPDESYDEMGETINYSVELKQAGLDDVAFFPVMPFPGTEIAERAGRSVLQGAIVDDVDIFDASFAGRRLRKYCAKPEVSLNPSFTPDQLRLLVRFAYQMFDLGQAVTDLEATFRTYIAFEQDGVHGSPPLSSTV